MTKKETPEEKLGLRAIQLEGHHSHKANEEEKKKLKTIINFPNSHPTSETLEDAEKFLREFHKKYGPEIETYTGPKDRDTN